MPIRHTPRQATVVVTAKPNTDAQSEHDVEAPSSLLANTVQIVVDRYTLLSPRSGKAWEIRAIKEASYPASPFVEAYRSCCTRTPTSGQPSDCVTTSETLTLRDVAAILG